MNTRKFLLFLAALAGLTGSAFAQTQASEATVAKLTGSATVTLADGSQKTLQQGDKIPQGATIVTAADGDLYLQMHNSTMANLKPNTTVVVEELSVTTKGDSVTKENTTLNLKSGDLVSALDPAKRKVNNYNVRTPKGVAAARGTIFTISVQSADGVTYNVTVNTVLGTVAVTNPSTGAVVSVGAGTASINNSTATTVANLPAADKQAVVNSMTVAAAALAVAADNGLISSTEFHSATTSILTSAPQAATAVQAAVQSVSTTQAAAIQTETTQAAATAPQTSSTAPTTTTQPATPPPTPTQPQPIDPSTVSRSG